MSVDHLAVATLLARVGDDIVLPRFRNLADADIELKAPDDYVTVADRESEIALAEGIARIDPSSRIIGEEACAADASLMNGAGEGRLWLIDPIDGTGNYAAGRAPFGIMVALIENGETLAGWLYDPLTRRLCHAILGGGAFIDGDRVTARATGSDLPIAALATYFLTPERRAEIADRSTDKLTIVDIPRCAAEQYPRLVVGENDIALFEKTLPWDHAAGALFLEEAGGRCRRADGSRYRVGDQRKGLLGASSARLWELAAPILF